MHQTPKTDMNAPLHFSYFSFNLHIVSVCLLLTFIIQQPFVLRLRSGVLAIWKIHLF